jgi:hypothetical protein
MSDSHTTRAAAVTLLIALLCCACCAQAPQQGKPTLLVFESASCGPCHQFDADFANIKSFARDLRKWFHCRPAWLYKKHRAKFHEYNVTTVPVFIVVDANGVELKRVDGYTSATKLMAELTTGWNKPEKQQPENRLPPNEDVQANRVREINERLQQRLQETQDALRITEDRLQAERKRPRGSAANDAQRQRQIDALEQAKARAEAEAEELRERLKQPSAPPAKSPPPTVPPVARSDTSKDSGQSQRGFFRTVLHHGVRLALDVGLTQAQSEIVVPLIAGGGPVGIAAGAGWMLLKAWRRRRQRNTGQKTVVVDAPTPPAREQIETQIVNVENDNYQRAHEQARQHVVRRYPGSQEVLEAELSLTRQFMAGHIS